MNVQDVIKDQVTKNPVVLYMKGSPDFPQCGFSASVVNILNTLIPKYATVNVLSDADEAAASFLLAQRQVELGLRDVPRFQEPLAQPLGRPGRSRVFWRRDGGGLGHCDLRFTSGDW